MEKKKVFPNNGLQTVERVKFVTIKIMYLFLIIQLIGLMEIKRTMLRII